MPRAPRVPSYRHHKASGQAVVTIEGRDHYLGKFGTPESRAEYARLIAELGVPGARLRARPDLTVAELLVAYLEHADGYYRRADGTPTTEPASIRQTVRPLLALYAHTPAAEFGPLALKAVRQRMIDDGLCRNEVNKRVGRIKRVFAWAVSEELVPPSVHHALAAVAGLRPGRSDARESRPVGPVADAWVEAILPKLAPPVAAMVRLQRLTGMRPGEVCAMRACDLDTSGAVWLYTPAAHKTAHHGKRRVIPIGPRAQAVLRPWLRPELAAPLFSPRERMEALSRERRAGRRTPLTPSQRARTRKPAPARAPGAAYTPKSYYHAIRRACDEAGVPRWHPHQLRHTAATELRRAYGLDVARAVLGHTSPAVTEVYAEVDMGKAMDAMRQIG